VSGPVVFAFEEGDVEAAVALWERCALTRPWNDPRADVARALAGPTSTVLAVREGGRLVATAMVGHDGHRGWMYYVAVDPDHRGRGLGRLVVTAAEEWLSGQVPKAMLMVRAANEAAVGFYEGLGYQAEEVRVFSRWL
jgi:ribosomal protein S18 acetylase RimI-like enzyme